MKISRKYTDNMGHYYAFSIEEAVANFGHLLDPNYNYNQHSTQELLAILRSQLCREFPLFHSTIKAELANRPHIPTAKEAKKKRQDKAKEQKNR